MYSLLLSFVFLPLSTVNARTCCCAAFTYESCEAEHDASSGHCVWRERPAFGPSTGEKGVCRTEQWVAIQQNAHNHHPIHTTSSTTVAPNHFISIPKKKFSSDPLSSADKVEADGLILQHDADPADPDDLDWPSVCFTADALLLPCNAIEANHHGKNAALFVEDGHIERFGKTLSVGVVCSIISLIAFIGLVVGFSIYWQVDKDATPEEYALDDINVVRSYSTFQSKS